MDKIDEKKEEYLSLHKNTKDMNNNNKMNVEEIKYYENLIEEKEDEVIVKKITKLADQIILNCLTQINKELEYDNIEKSTIRFYLNIIEIINN